MPRHKRPEFVNLVTKQEFIKKYREGFYKNLTKSDIASQFNVDSRTIRHWLQNAETILETPHGRARSLTRIVRKKKAESSGGM